MKRKVIVIMLLVAAVALCAAPQVARPVMRAVRAVKGSRTISQRVAQYGAEVRGRLKPDFDRLGVAYPPRRVVLAAFKAERRLEVWVADEAGRFQLLKSYPILAASGVLGPKLKEGDCQVPEGLYRVELLNPNSLYHLSLRLNYPNDFDRSKAARENRTQLGGDIMIHGNACSIGCLAMGDPASEDLFVLAAETGIAAIEVIVSPVDFRTTALAERPPQAPAWYYELCGLIRARLLLLKDEPPVNKKGIK
jgi:hypothetical protein